MAEEIVLSDRNVPRQPLEDELTRLYSQGFLTDITLSTEDGKNFEAHRILLAARSQYFHSIVPRLKAEPVIFLKGIKGAHLDKILKFMYGTRVAVSKHQLKPILEVAKNLQVKGLQDVSASEVLSRQSVVSAGRFKPDSPLASPILAASKLAQSRQMQSSTTLDKTTLASFKSPMGRRGRTMMNGSPTPSDSEEQRVGGNQESDDESGPRTRKGRRGRPPKKDKTASKEKSKGDPYEFEEDDDKNEASQSGDEQDSNKRGWRYQSDRKRKGEEDGEGSERAGSPSQDEESGSAKKKRTISVKCKGNLADLYPTRFVSGVRGQCIKFKDQLMTPQEFEIACGGSGKKYLENIKTDYGPLKTLTASGMLRQLQGRAGRSESPPSRSPSKSSKRQRENEEEGNEEDDEDGEDDEDNEEHQEETNEEEEADEEEDEEEEEGESEAMQQQEMVEEQEKDTQTDGLIIRGKKKKKKHRDDWKKHLTTHLKTEVIMHNEHQPQQQQQQHLQPIMFSGSNDPLGLMTSMPQPTFAAPNIMDQPPKISPANLIHEHHHQQQQQTQTLYVMSPHPSMTPQHHAFAPPMSPMPHNPPTPIPSFSMPVVSNAQPTFAEPMTPIPSTQSQISQMGMSTMGSSRIGNILNVRCKSTTAILVASKYESGSKGKCIQLGDEWLTPNEFEDRAGSKAKKYLSSIKCMGRPLRVYVNSGELRGANPPPQPKSKQKQLKQMPQTHQQAIAPAPLQGPSMTPTHISNAPSMPHGLIMSGNQTPILFNQTSMASSMIGNQPINLPMTFALASPLEVRQNVSQPM